MTRQTDRQTERTDARPLHSVRAFHTVHAGSANNVCKRNKNVTSSECSSTPRLMLKKWGMAFKATRNMPFSLVLHKLSSL